MTLRRLVDVVVAGAALALLAPVLGLAALAVRLTSRGPVVFRQERVGRGGRPFVGSSRVDLQACKLEYSIVSPK